MNNPYDFKVPDFTSGPSGAVPSGGEPGAHANGEAARNEASEFPVDSAEWSGLSSSNSQGEPPDERFFGLHIGMPGGCDALLGDREKSSQPDVFGITDNDLLDLLTKTPPSDFLPPNFLYETHGEIPSAISGGSAQQPGTLPPAIAVASELRGGGATTRAEIPPCGLHGEQDVPDAMGVVQLYFKQDGLVKAAADSENLMSTREYINLFFGCDAPPAEPDAQRELNPAMTQESHLMSKSETLSGDDSAQQTGTQLVRVDLKSSVGTTAEQLQRSVGAAVGNSGGAGDDHAYAYDIYIATTDAPKDTTEGEQHESASNDVAEATPTINTQRDSASCGIIGCGSISASPLQYQCTPSRFPFPLEEVPDTLLPQRQALGLTGGASSPAEQSAASATLQLEEASRAGDERKLSKEKKEMRKRAKLKRKQDEEEEKATHWIFFTLNAHDKYTRRCVFASIDGSQIDPPRIRPGCRRALFPQDSYWNSSDNHPDKVQPLLSNSLLQQTVQVTGSTSTPAVQSASAAVQPDTQKALVSELLKNAKEMVKSLGPNAPINRTPTVPTPLSTSAPPTPTAAESPASGSDASASHTPAAAVTGSNGAYYRFHDNGRKIIGKEEPNPFFRIYFVCSEHLSGCLAKCHFDYFGEQASPRITYFREHNHDPPEEKRKRRRL